MLKQILPVVSSILVLGSGFSYAQEAPDLEKRVQELELKLNAMESESRSAAFPELSGLGESFNGLGAGASKVYYVPAGVSIGGYGEAFYSHSDEKTDVADFLRAVIYVGYKFDDNWVLNTEFEFEHASTGEEGSVSVEFATLDYLHSDALNGRVGMVLVPMGLINELHEPNTFYAVNRPSTETQLIPSTWRENGFGLFGTVNETLQYRAYIVNGLDASGFTESGLRGGRQKGSKAKAEDLAAVVRMDYVPSSDMLVGGSLYYGNSGQDLDVDVPTFIGEVHADMTFQGLRFRALAALGMLDDVAELNRALAEPGTADADIDSIGEEMFGWYLEAGYDLFIHRDADDEKALIPFVRYEELNVQEETPAGFAASGKGNKDIVTFGINYLPLDEIVFKLDFARVESGDGSDDELINLSFGYVF